MAAHALPRMTPEEYLEFDRAAEFKHEYYDGAVFAMAGGSVRHAIVIGNLFAALHSALRKRRCIATPTEVRVRATPRTYVYPDIVIVCGDPHYGDAHKDILLNPSVVVEVLSPSTERHDRGLKAARYRMLETLQEYALVSQEEPRVEIFRRQPSGEWLLSEAAGLDSACVFTAVDGEPVRIPLAGIYERVEFEPQEATSPSGTTAP